MTPHKHDAFYPGKIEQKKGATEESTAHSIIHLRSIIFSCICCFVWKYLSSPPALLIFLAESENDLTIERSSILPYILIAYFDSHISWFVEGSKTKTNGEPTGYERSRSNERTVSLELWAGPLYWILLWDYRCMHNPTHLRADERGERRTRDSEKGLDAYMWMSQRGTRRKSWKELAFIGVFRRDWFVLSNGVGILA